MQMLNLMPQNKGNGDKTTPAASSEGQILVNGAYQE